MPKKRRSNKTSQVPTNNPEDEQSLQQEKNDANVAETESKKKQEEKEVLSFIEGFLRSANLSVRDEEQVVTKYTKLLISKGLEHESQLALLTEERLIKYGVLELHAAAIAEKTKNYGRKGDETKLANQLSNISLYESNITSNEKDITHYFVRKMIRPISKEEIPPIEFLSKAIEPDHLSVKIPVLPKLYNQCLERYNILADEEFNSVFTLSADGTHCEILFRDLWACLFSPPMCGTTEDSHHSLWDAVIVRPLKMFVPDLIWDRNTNKGASTSDSHRPPDVVCVLNRIAIFRGEEKGPENNESPMEELGKKLDWNYKDLPYLLGYHAVGKFVTFDAITPSREVISISPTYNLDKIEHRFRVFILLSKLATLLEPLSHMCSNPPV